MKTCKTCDTSKDVSSFGKHKDTKDGYRPVCKSCRSAAQQVWAMANVEKVAAYKSKYYEDNKERLTEYKAAHYQDNKDHYSDLHRQWVSNNKAASASHSAAYRAAKLNATPEWLTDTHKAHMKRTYALSEMMTEATGTTYHVDHIVPLQGKNVCGLHVPWNLQALRADLNMSKSNKHDPKDNSSYA